MGAGIHRNEPCNCGSGLKYKNCCLKAAYIKEEIEKKQRMIEKIRKQEEAARIESEFARIAGLLAKDGNLLDFDYMEILQDSNGRYITKQYIELLTLEDNNLITEYMISAERKRSADSKVAGLLGMLAGIGNMDRYNDMFSPVKRKR